MERYRLLEDEFPLDYHRVRKRPECCCFLLLLIALLLYTGVLLTALAWDGEKLLRPYDSEGRHCEEPFPLLYFVSPAEDSYYTACVQSCASVSYSCRPNYWVLTCEFTVRTDLLGNVTEPGYPSEELWGVFCYPKAEIRALIRPALSDFTAWLLSVQPPRSVLELMAAIGVNCLAWVVPCAFCLLVFLLMRYISQPVLWLSGLVLGLMLGYTAYQTCEGAESLYQGLSGALIGLVAGIYLFLLLLLHRELEFVSTVLKLGCSFLYSQFLTILIGSIAFPLACSALAIGLYLGVITYSTGNLITSGTDTPFRQFFFPLLQLDMRTLALLLFEALVMLWSVLFCLYYAHMAIAACVIKWYRRPAEALPLLQFLPSLFATLRSGAGQASLGAFLQASVGSLALVLLTLTTVITENYQGPGRWAVQGFLICSGVAACGFSLLIRYVLIYSTLMDRGVVASLHPAYILLTTNPLSFLVYKVLFLVWEVAGVVGLSWGSLVVASMYLDFEGSPGPAALVAALGIVASVGVVLEVFRSVVDTLIICLFQDMATDTTDTTQRPSLAATTLADHRHTISTPN